MKHAHAVSNNYRVW